MLYPFPLPNYSNIFITINHKLRHIKEPDCDDCLSILLFNSVCTVYYAETQETCEILTAKVVCKCIYQMVAHRLK